MIFLLFLFTEKSAKVAITLSIIFPGGGQIYTKNYVKAGLLGAAQGFLIYKTYTSIQEVKDAEKQYKNFPSDSNSTILSNKTLSRDTILWWDAIVWFLAASDAYVDAKLYNFNKNTAIIFSPNPYNTLVMIRLRF